MDIQSYDNQRCLSSYILVRNGNREEKRKHICKWNEIIVGDIEIGECVYIKDRGAIIGFVGE